MTILDNPKHELFAQELAKGTSASEAYVLAGYAKDDGNASRLTGNDKVKARVAEILSAGAAQAGVTAARVIAELARIGFADIRKVVSWRPEMTRVAEEAEDGQVAREVLVSRVTVIGSANLTDDTAAAIAEVSQSANGSLRVKMHDKPAALEKLGRALGMFKDRVEHTGDGGPVKVRDELELGRRLAFVLELIARGEVKAKLPGAGNVER
jgi:phage terminase small subunit